MIQFHDAVYGRHTRYTVYGNQISNRLSRIIGTSLICYVICSILIYFTAACQGLSLPECLAEEMVKRLHSLAQESEPVALASK